MGVMNRLTGEWTYHVDETDANLRITRLGRTFRQVKVPGATYELLPQGVKETIQIRFVSDEPIVSVPLFTTYDVAVLEGTIFLQDGMGIAAWKTGPFHAWDFGRPPLVFADPKDYDRLAMGDRVRALGLLEGLRTGQPVEATNVSRGGSFRLTYDLSQRQREILLAGGGIRYLQQSRNRSA